MKTFLHLCGRELHARALMEQANAGLRRAIGVQPSPRLPHRCHLSRAVQGIPPSAGSQRESALLRAAVMPRLTAD
jgi:hypothetical protein